MKKNILFVILAIALVFTTYSSIKLYSSGKQAYNAGQIDQAMEVQEKIQAAYAALGQIQLPDKSKTWYPDQVNSKGEQHSRLRNGQGIQQFVYNNCDKQTQEIWKQAAEYAAKNNVIPEIVFAIAWADTGCGNSLTTPHNVGNINNNDRGNRVGFFNHLDGYRAIVDTLNNRYIGQSTMIGQLSGGGRLKIDAQHDCRNAIMGYKCYATSMENWHNNVTRAMNIMISPSEVVGGYYKFRP